MTAYPFLDPSLQERIQDLVSRLTVEEKASFIPTRNQAVERLGNYFLHEKRDNAIPTVFNKSDGGWRRFAALVFANGNTSACSAMVQGVPGSRIELRLDAPDGALAGTITVPNTGDISFLPLEKNSPRRRPVWAGIEAPTEKPGSGVLNFEDFTGGVSI